MTGSAFRTTDPEAVAALAQYRAACVHIQHSRNELTAHYENRNLFVARHGFGRGTRVVGFERFEADNDGDLLGDNGELIVPKASAKQPHIVAPNTRRKSGQALAALLLRYDTPDLDIPGLPSYLMGSAETAMGIAVHTPAVWSWGTGEGTVLYAYWDTDDAALADAMGEMWEAIPLSTYYLAKEQHDAEQAAAAVSGNESNDG